MKTIKEIQNKKRLMKDIRPLTKEEYGLKKYEEALKDMIKLIDDIIDRLYIEGNANLSVSLIELKERIKG